MSKALEVVQLAKEVADGIAAAQADADRVLADRDRLAKELDAARERLDLVQPSLDRLTRLTEQQGQELINLRRQNEEQAEKLNEAAEREANQLGSITDAEFPAGRTPLTRAAQAGAAFFHGNQQDKQQYLRDRGWIVQPLGWKDPQGEDGHLLDNALRLQVKRDAGAFRFMLESQKAMGAVA